MINKIIEKINKLSLPVVILIASVILGGFFYASQVSKQKSIERQQEIKLQDDRRVGLAKTEQEHKEYVTKRKLECYDIEQRERKNWNNLDGSGYNEDRDVCIVRYKEDYKGVDCKKEYEGLPNLQFQCELGIFTKEF